MERTLNSNPVFQGFEGSRRCSSKCSKVKFQMWRDFWFSSAGKILQAGFSAIINFLSTNGTSGSLWRAISNGFATKVRVRKVMNMGSTIGNSAGYKTVKYNVHALRFDGAYTENDDHTTDWWTANWSEGFLCELPSGKVLTSYKDSESLCKLSVVGGMEDILYHNNRSGINEYTFVTATGNSYLLPFVAPYDGEVYLLDIQTANCDASPVIPCEINLYKSTDKGLGQSWVWQNRLFYETHAQHNTFSTDAHGTIHIKGNNIVVPFMSIGDYSGYGYGKWMCLYSTNGGLNWSISTIRYSTNTFNGSSKLLNIPSVWESGGTYFVAMHNDNYTGYWNIFSSTNLVNWTIWVYDVASLPKEWVGTVAFNFTTVADSKYLYLLYEKAGTHTTRRLISSMPTSYSDFIDLSKWEDVTETIRFAIDDWDARTYNSRTDDILVIESSHFGGMSAIITQGYGDARDSFRAKISYKVNDEWGRTKQ